VHRRPAEAQFGGYVQLLTQAQDFRPQPAAFQTMMQPVDRVPEHNDGVIKIIDGPADRVPVFNDAGLAQAILQSGGLLLRSRSAGPG
jgi:hypothetical protein